MLEWKTKHVLQHFDEQDSEWMEAIHQAGLCLQASCFQSGEKILKQILNQTSRYHCKTRNIWYCGLFFYSNVTLTAILHIQAKANILPTTLWKLYKYKTNTCPIENKQLQYPFYWPENSDTKSCSQSVTAILSHLNYANVNTLHR